MRAFLFVVGVLALLPVHSSAQVSDDSPTRAPITSSVRSLHGMTQVGTLGSMPTNPRVHCCNRKGALIGAAIGVALGAALATLCDAGDCTSAYLGSMAILGGIGAGSGAESFGCRRGSRFAARVRDASVLSEQRQRRCSRGDSRSARMTSLALST